jgi:hypothetical protein
MHATPTQPGLWRRSGDKLSEPVQVLGDGCQRELELGSARPAQSQTAKSEDALQVGEQHLDALAVAAGLFKGLGLRQRTRHIASVLVHVAHDPAGGHVRAAFWLERGRPAHRHGCEIAHRMVGADGTRGPQKLARRTGVKVARLVEGEVLREMFLNGQPPTVSGREKGARLEVTNLLAEIRAIVDEANSNNTIRKAG